MTSALAVQHWLAKMRVMAQGTWEGVLVVRRPFLDRLQAVVVERPPAANVWVWHPHLLHLQQLLSTSVALLRLQSWPDGCLG